jgi:hypothetical protein
MGLMIGFMLICVVLLPKLMDSIGMFNSLQVGCLIVNMERMILQPAIYSSASANIVSCMSVIESIL